MTVSKKRNAIMYSFILFFMLTQLANIQKGVKKVGPKKWSKMSSGMTIFRVLLCRGKPGKGGLRVEVFSSVKLIGGTTFGHFGQKWYPPKKVFLGCEKT